MPAQTETEKIIESFNDTLDNWLSELELYDFDQLCSKPSPGSWSLGQVYVHLIEVSGYFFQQIDICLSNNDNETEEASTAGKNMFLANNFPDKLLEGPPSNKATQQPRDKEQLKNGMLSLKDKIRSAGIKISDSPFKGKTKHPGLQYFNAPEWLQFADMHLRHHFRQKKRIDEFLKAGAAKE